MLKKRLISVLLIRNGGVVQSVQFKHTNMIHWDPGVAVDFYDKWAVDEIVVLDVDRETRKRDKFYSAIENLSANCFVPLTVGGWVDTVDEMRKLLRMGADKVSINSAAVNRPEFITECAKTFGNQCVVVSIDSKKDNDGVERVATNRGKNLTELQTVAWAREAERHGAGELFLNSIDHDGFRKGYNLELLRSVTQAVDIPVIAMGGVLKWDHLADGILDGGADAVAAANIFHYTEHSTKHAKKAMREAGINVR